MRVFIDATRQCSERADKVDASPAVSDVGIRSAKQPLFVPVGRQNRGGRIGNWSGRLVRLFAKTKGLENPLDIFSLHSLRHVSSPPTRLVSWLEWLSP